MKTPLFNRFVFLLLLAGCSGSPGSPDIPGTVTESFRSKYGEIKPDWVAAGHHYEALFQWEGHDYKASFDSTGNWLKSEVTIPANEIPLVIMSTITNAYKGSNIAKAIKVEKPDSELTYVLHIRRRGTVTPTEFSSGGVILGEPASQ